MAKAKKTKAPKQPQTKIPGTGRLDANEKIEAQAEVVRLKCAKRMELEQEERAERDTLTELLKAEGYKPGEPYTYEDGDGEMRDAFIPEIDESPRAKVRKHRNTVEADE
jgi:hypothetical protein